MEKCRRDGSDPYLELLNIRNTPRDGTLGSSAQRLKSRRLRTIVPDSYSDSRYTVKTILLTFQNGPCNTSYWEHTFHWDIHWGHSFRKRKGRPSIGDPVDDVRLQNVGVHMPVYTLSRRDCRVCNEKITRSGSACVTGAGPSRDGGKSYDTDRHRSHVLLSVDMFQLTGPPVMLPFA